MLIEMLTQEEARVLGTLIEKSLATPDYYPLTLNSLRTACNQKSNRDPVTEYNDETVTEALVGLKRKVLVTFIPYGSQGTLYKYRHFLEDPRFNLSKSETAVLAVLLLRGSQTLNEVKMRASSLLEIESLEAAEALLKGLAQRSDPLVENLSKRPGWKEPRWRDRIRPPIELLTSTGSAASQLHSPSHSADSFPLTEGTNELPTGLPVRTQREEIEALKSEIAELRSQFMALKEEVEKIKAELY